MKVFSEFFQAFRKFGLEYFQRYYSTYPGIVTDNKDPDMRGRIKVELPSLFGDGVEHTAWVEPHGFNNAGQDHGEFFPPYVDDVVDVWFENGDINYPFYKGGSYAEDELHEAFKASYPFVKGWILDSGQKILFDETDGKLQIRIENGDSGGFIVLDDTEGKEGIFFTHSSGSQMQFQKDGSVVIATPGGNLVFLDDAEGAVTLTSAKGVVFSVKDKIMFTDATGKNIISITDKSVEITASSDVVLTAQNVNVNSGNINLGNGASDNAVLYSKLASIFDSHIHPTAVGPSGPPGPVPTMTFSGTESIPPLSAKAGNVKLKGNL